ncbi:MAG: DUF3427 domain-containing protein [Tissierella sp.]|nr:DUF3427 domain-containing protein [Tissierella sp.]
MTQKVRSSVSFLFITINKNESDYLPSTMYNDYAISSELFNWESQSTTSVETPTGQRYINDRSEGIRSYSLLTSLTIIGAIFRLPMMLSQLHHQLRINPFKSIKILFSQLLY